MYSYCARCGLKVEEWEIPEEDWTVVQEPGEPVICGYCNMLGETDLNDFPLMVRCDKCGDLWYEYDLRLLNELMLCEDCIDFRDAWYRFEDEPPARIEPDISSQSYSYRNPERREDYQSGSSISPPSERKDDESKDSTLTSHEGPLQTSTSIDKEPPSRERRKAKVVGSTFEPNDGQPPPPLATNQEPEQREERKDRTESHTPSPVAKKPVNTEQQTGPNQKGEKGCMSGAVLIAICVLTFVLMLSHSSGEHGLSTRDVASQQPGLDEAFAAQKNTDGFLSFGNDIGPTILGEGR